MKNTLTAVLRACFLRSRQHLRTHSVIYCVVVTTLQTPGRENQRQQQPAIRPRPPRQLPLPQPHPPKKHGQHRTKHRKSTHSSVGERSVTLTYPQNPNPKPARDTAPAPRAQVQTSKPVANYTPEHSSSASFVAVEAFGLAWKSSSSRQPRILGSSAPNTKRKTSRRLNMLKKQTTWTFPAIFASNDSNFVSR